MPDRYALLAVLAALAAVSGCSEGGTGPEPERALELHLPGPHAPTVGQELPVAVEVRDGGEPAEGVAVAWELTGGDGGIEPAAPSTNRAGRAEASWRVGRQAGPRLLRVQVPGAEPLEVELEAAAGPAVGVAFASDTIVLSARRERLDPGVRFEDEFGNAAEPVGEVALEVEDPQVAVLEADGRLRAMKEGETTLVLDSSLGSASAQVMVAFRGVITVTFDDGFASVHTRAFPVLQALGLRANVAVVTEAIDYWEAYLTLAQLQELDAAGWAMTSHSVTHRDLTTLSDVELEEELAESRAWLEERSFRGAGVFVVPFHSWDERVRDAVARHYEIARGTSTLKVFPDTLAIWMPDDPHALTALEAEEAGVDTAEGRALIRELIERALDEGRAFELFFHDIRADMLDDFVAIMEIVAEFADDVVTFDEIHARYTSSLPAGALAK